jgi:hypothetical protein
MVEVVDICSSQETVAYWPNSMETEAGPSRGRSITPPVVEHQVIVVSSDDEKLVGGASSKTKMDPRRPPPKTITCTFCDKKFGTTGELTKHIRAEHPEKVIVNQHECPHNGCTMSYTRYNDLARHLRKHDSTPKRKRTKPRQQCQYCKKSFTELHEHIRRVHNKYERRTKCPYCDKKVPDNELNKHIKLYHDPNRQSLVCDDCGSTFLGGRKNQEFKHHFIRYHLKSYPSAEEPGCYCRNNPLDKYYCTYCSYVCLNLSYMLTVHREICTKMNAEANLRHDQMRFYKEKLKLLEQADPTYPASQFPTRAKDFLLGTGLIYDLDSQHQTKVSLISVNAPTDKRLNEFYKIRNNSSNRPTMTNLEEKHEKIQFNPEVVKQLNKILKEPSQNGHCVDARSGGHCRKSNFNVQSDTVNHNFMILLLYFYNALIARGYTVRCIDCAITQDMLSESHFAKKSSGIPFREMKIGDYHIPVGFARYYMCVNKTTRERISFAFITTNYGAEKFKYNPFQRYGELWKLLMPFAIDLPAFIKITKFKLDPKCVADTHNVFYGKAAPPLNLEGYFKYPEKKEQENVAGPSSC